MEQRQGRAEPEAPIQGIWLRERESEIGRQHRRAAPGTRILESRQVRLQSHRWYVECPPRREQRPLLGTDRIVELPQFRRCIERLHDHEPSKRAERSRILDVRPELLEARREFGVIEPRFGRQEVFFDRTVQHAVYNHLRLVASRVRVNHILAVRGDLALPTEYLVTPSGSQVYA